eukprot:gene28832-35804_t
MESSSEREHMKTEAILALDGKISNLRSSRESATSTTGDSPTSAIRQTIRYELQIPTFSRGETSEKENQPISADMGEPKRKYPDSATPVSTWERSRNVALLQLERVNSALRTEIAQFGKKEDAMEEEKRLIREEELVKAKEACGEEMRSLQRHNQLLKSRMLERAFFAMRCRQTQAVLNAI